MNWYPQSSCYPYFIENRLSFSVFNHNMQHFTKTAHATAGQEALPTLPHLEHWYSIARKLSARWPSIEEVELFDVSHGLFGERHDDLWNTWHLFLVCFSVGSLRLSFHASEMEIVALHNRSNQPLKNFMNNFLPSNKPMLAWSNTYWASFLIPSPLSSKPLLSNSKATFKDPSRNRDRQNFCFVWRLFARWNLWLQMEVFLDYLANRKLAENTIEAKASLVQPAKAAFIPFSLSLLRLRYFTNSCFFCSSVSVSIFLGGIQGKKNGKGVSILLWFCVGILPIAFVSTSRTDGRSFNRSVRRIAWRRTLKF